MASRPNFKEISSLEEFHQYYWYREELSQLCKLLGLEYRGTKKELNHMIEEYYKGNIIKKTTKKFEKKQADQLTIDTPLLECNFSLNAKFREYFSVLTGVSPFKFTADMATAWRKVKSEKDQSFTIRNMIDIYYGRSNYAKYDPSVCQWNQFIKDFCADEKSAMFTNKLKVASILWKEIRDSTKDKVYTRELLETCFENVKEYRK